jgi:hypothetical protein
LYQLVIIVDVILKIRTKIVNYGIILRGEGGERETGIAVNLRLSAKINSWVKVSPPFEGVVAVPL